MDFPEFYGGDKVREWIKEVEQFFDREGIEEEMKIKIACLYMKEGAWIWHQAFTKNQRKVILWDEYVTNLSIRFGDLTQKKPMGNFRKSRPTGVPMEGVRRKSERDYQIDEVITSIKEIIKETQKCLREGVEASRKAVEESKRKMRVSQELDKNNTNTEVEGIFLSTSTNEVEAKNEIKVSLNSISTHSLVDSVKLNHIVQLADNEIVEENIGCEPLLINYPIFHNTSHVFGEVSEKKFNDNVVAIMSENHVLPITYIEDKKIVEHVLENDDSCTPTVC